MGKLPAAPRATRCCFAPSPTFVNGKVRSRVLRSCCPLRLLDRLLGRNPGDHFLQLLVGLFSRPGRECPRRSTLRAADVVSKCLTTLVFCADGSVILAHGAGFVTKLCKRGQMPYIWTPSMG